MELQVCGLWFRVAGKPSCRRRYPRPPPAPAPDPRSNKNKTARRLEVQPAGGGFGSYYFFFLGELICGLRGLHLGGPGGTLLELVQRGCSIHKLLLPV